MFSSLAECRRVKSFLHKMPTDNLVTRLMRLQAEEPNSQEIPIIHKIIMERRELDLMKNKD